VVGRKLYVGLDVPAGRYVIKKNMEAFWGDIGNLANTALQRIKKDTTVMFKVGKSRWLCPPQPSRAHRPAS
jgi:hypothetical protein